MEWRGGGRGRGRLRLGKDCESQKMTKIRINQKIVRIKIVWKLEMKKWNIWKQGTFTLVKVITFFVCDEMLSTIIFLHATVNFLWLFNFLCNFGISGSKIYTVTFCIQNITENIPHLLQNQQTTSWSFAVKR